MEKTVKKNYYLTPAVKVVAFQVEQGFAGTETRNLNVGVTSTQITELRPNVEQGTESFIPRDLQ